MTVYKECRCCGTSGTIFQDIVGGVDGEVLMGKVTKKCFVVAPPWAQSDHLRYAPDSLPGGQVAWGCSAQSLTTVECQGVAFPSLPVSVTVEWGGTD